MANTDMPEKLGRYEIVRVLGKGAMGVVYEGRDPNIDRRVAIKTARRDVMEASGMADEMMTRFLREARAAGVLNHPNIITIYDADEEGGIAYIAMEFLEGGDLLDAIEKRRAFSTEEIAELGATICGALAAAHDQGIVHRDIKPANVILPEGKPLKLADFGIAHVSDSNLTQDGALIGTPHYMSPEQFMGQKVDGRSDLFSVGIILYEMLTGEKPFTGEALSTVMHHVIKSAPTAPSELNFAIPDALSQVVLKALAKRPNERYQDGRAMATALRESVKEHPDPAKLGFGPVQDAGATVVMGAPNGAGATVVSQGPPPEAPSAREDATVVSAPPVETAATPAVPAKKPTVKVIGVAVAVLAVLLGGVFVFMGGGGETPPPQENPPAGNPNTAHFESLVFQLYRAQTWDDYSNYEDNKRDWALLEGKVDKIDSGDVTLVLDDDKTVSEKGFANGAKIDLPSHPAKVQYTVTGPGPNDEVQGTIEAQGPTPTRVEKIIFGPLE